MVFTPHGKHLIAGNWMATAEQFDSAPAHGPSSSFSVGTADLVDQATEAAEAAFWTYGYSHRSARASFLNAIADEIEARAEEITDIGVRETGLPAARLQGELQRTMGQIRLFADHIASGNYLDRRHDPALPERTPLPRPDIRLMQRPVGPVAVFGASNFPLAFSTAGGDTASALAAGCPVVVKGHPAHPGTGEIMAEAVLAAIRSCGIDPGVFNLIQGDKHDVGSSLVQHPLINAVGFTGSLAGGRALFDLCAKRPEPIPFFGELGSVNPMFLLPSAMAMRAEALATGWAASLTMGAGQFCTNPGVAVMIDGPAADAFITAARAAVAQVAPQLMLTRGIAESYRAGRDRIANCAGVQNVFSSASEDRSAAPALFATTGKTWLENHALADEVFGPLGLVVRVTDMDEMLGVALRLQGQLTCTIHMDAADTEAARRVLPILERKAGRLLANGYPTGVEVCDAMVHGGPYPATTNFGATSVGTMSIRRFLRPVSYQNIPQSVLPDNMS